MGGGGLRAEQGPQRQGTDLSGRGWFPYMRMYGATKKAFNDAYKFPTVNKVKNFSEYIK